MQARRVCERDSERSRGLDWNASLPGMAVVQTTKRCSVSSEEVQSCSGALHDLKAVSAH